MTNFSTTPFASHIRPWRLLIITLASSLLGFHLVGLLIGSLFIFPFYEGNITDFIRVLQSPLDNPPVKIFLMIIQGVGSAFGMIFVPWLIYNKLLKVPLKFGQNKANVQLTFITLLITLFYMVVNSFVVEWNQYIRLHPSLHEIEQVLQMMEERMRVLTAFLVEFNSFWEFLLGLLVIAVIPAIGEELVFRGLVQNHLMRITKNIHIAIWSAAVIFSIIHLQFYGLFPRILLGALFGYLYYFSGKLSYAIIAHFFNNGIAIIAIYLHQIEVIDYDIRSNELLVWYQILIAAAVFIVLLFGFKQLAKKKLYAEVEKNI